ncbi:putative toxin-antitoxin system toxin component, PIN family [Azospirillum sp.]|uniref:putative toxin-antitoxin system toxin component, PIN family n=1 Tax=Azospirillum sp. TaxID=34012 RepID=UPI002D232264|nr:putative toxin-antitoxin system toxin component, PIN family [Azospirillum sp.]HYD65529.1 putative toxin-antitoxin system toxin component, PIN family [Azospirillum sp.]
MRLVLDCNVIVSAAWNPGIARTVLLYGVRHHEIVVSATILAEYRRVAGYAKLARIRSTLDGLIDLVEAVALLVEGGPVDHQLPDPTDVIYLAAAHDGDAAIVITGNVKDFPDRQYGPVRVLTVREFATAAGILV